MLIQCQWKNGMLFGASQGTHSVSMDGKKPFGADSEMSPKELVIAGLCGCTAMDVIGLLKKHKETVESFIVEAKVELSNAGHPIVFSKVFLTFKLVGPINPEVLVDSIRLSQTKYCGVSAMLSKAFPINYVVILNDNEIGRGEASFS